MGQRFYDSLFIKAISCLAIVMALSVISFSAAHSSTPPQDQRQLDTTMANYLHGFDDQSESATKLSQSSFGSVNHAEGKVESFGHCSDNLCLSIVMIEDQKSSPNNSIGKTVSLQNLDMASEDLPQVLRPPQFNISVQS